MLINTKFLGEVEIIEEQIINFDCGLPGFPEERKFVLLSIEEDVPFVLLQSINNEHIGFVIAYPFAFKEDYAFDLNEEDKQLLQIDNEEDVLVYSIVTLKENFQQSTLNLLAPIVINNNKKLGRQIVLQDSTQYSLRYPVSMAISKGSGK
jgi:flagellar assembly factor FliW